MKRSLLSVFQCGTDAQYDPLSSSIISEWESPSNIALVKYWGKKDGQLPANPSLSMTLSEAVTRTSVLAVPGFEGNDQLSVNGQSDHPFVSKLQTLVKWLSSEIPELENYSLQVKTANTFPHSTGIASSASGISAFSLCLLSIISKIKGMEVPEGEFFKIASYVSRRGSGSACRSVYGGYSLWGETPVLPDSSDFYAVAINDKVHPDFMKMHDAILVVSSSPKSLSSTHGHTLMNFHPYARVRIDQARDNIREMLEALQSGDFDKLAAISENEALTLHSLIMTSAGGNILLEPNSLAILKRVQMARKRGVQVSFTLDAGPNVHIIYPDKGNEDVENFIREELIQFCENRHVIFDQCREGPVEVKAE